MVGNRSKQMANIKLYLLLFLFLFNIKLRFIPIFTSNIIIALLGAVIALMNFGSQNFRFEKSVYIHIKIFCLLIFFSLASLIINKTMDLSFIKLFVVNNTVSLLAAYYISYFYYKNNISFVDFLKIFVYVYFGQMIIVCFFFFNRELANIVYSSIIDMGDRLNKKLEDLLEYRAFGISFGFDMGTADLTIALFFCVYLYLTQEKQYKRWLIIYLFCCAIGLLVARTMFLGIGISMLFYLFFPCKIKYRKMRALISLFFYLGIAIIIFALFFDIKKYMRTIMWITDIFVQFSSKKGLSSGSLYELTKGDMVFYPGTKTMLFGDGLYDINCVYRYTDVGYLRLLIYFGLYGTITYCLFIFSRANLLFFVKKSKQVLILTFFILIFQFIFLWKIYYQITSIPLLLMLGIYPTLRRTNAINRNDNLQRI